MSDFWTVLDEYIGSGFDTTDIRAMVRRCWFYDFDGYPLRIWQGQGRLFTSDGNMWLGTIDQNGQDVHSTPRIGDGRDGSSATYSFGLKIPDSPGIPALQMYNAIKTEQWRTVKRNIICYLALFQPNEGLRPQTPIVFFKELTMFAPKFSERIEMGSDGILKKKYSISISAKDGNFGRSEVPNGTYADTIQKERAKQLGVNLDRGCEFLAGLANRTYQLP